MFFLGIGVVELFFLNDFHALPLLNDFRHELRFPHSGELMLVLVVFLSGKLSV